MYILAMLSSQGNGIVASNSVKKADLGLNTKGDGTFFKTFEKEKGRKFRAAYTFPKANQDMWIRYWLAAGGVDPDKNVELLTLPAAWFLLESMRWKFYPAQLPSVAAAKALNDKVTREDLWKKAATELWVCRPRTSPRAPAEAASAFLTASSTTPPSPRPTWTASKSSADKATVIPGALGPNDCLCLSPLFTILRKVHTQLPEEATRVRRAITTFLSDAFVNDR